MRIAATDAASGRPVVLSRGPLAAAIRASIAVPFLFLSIKFEGRRLVDGVVSDPLPLRAASDAEVVIALAFAARCRARSNNASRLVAQVSTAMIDNLFDARLEPARGRGQRWRRCPRSSAR